MRCWFIILISLGIFPQLCAQLMAPVGFMIPDSFAIDAVDKALRGTLWCEDTITSRSTYTNKCVHWHFETTDELAELSYYEKGKRVLFYEWYPDGTHKEQYNAEDGWHATWYKSGQIKFLTQLRTSTDAIQYWLEWYEDGSINIERHLINGRSLRNFYWHANGQLSHKMDSTIQQGWTENGNLCYDYNKLTGVKKSWYPDGYMRSLLTDSINAEWYENGQCKKMYHNKRDHSDTSWYENGTISRLTRYHERVDSDITIFLENGIKSYYKEYKYGSKRSFTPLLDRKNRGKSRRQTIYPRRSYKTKKTIWDENGKIHEYKVTKRNKKGSVYERWTKWDSDGVSETMSWHRVSKGKWGRSAASSRAQF
jgi:hypothetical protein